MLPIRKGQAWLPSIFNDFLGNEWVAKANESSPSMNIMECEKRYRVEIATPGMTKDDFTLEIHNDNHLVITMKKNCECDTEMDPNCKCDEGKENDPNCKCDEKKETVKVTSKNTQKNEKAIKEPNCGCSYEQHEDGEKRHGKYLRREFTYSRFSQTLLLPDNVDKTKISAKQENGILTVFIPKKEEYIEANTVKKINIE